MMYSTTIMHSLVLGGLGFIGSHLVDRLVALGHIVTIADNCSSNSLSADHYVGTCTVITCDVCNLGSLEQPIDYVFHLASTVGPVRVAKHQGNLEDEFATATARAIEIALAHRARLIYVSSSDVYGQSGLCRESDQVRSWTRETPRAKYAAGKLKSEKLVSQAVNDEALSAVAIRLFNVAGPRQLPDGGFVVARFVRAGLSGRDLTVYGTGAQRRSFIHVHDAVDALLRAAFAKNVSGILNVGNPDNVVNILDLARLVASLLRTTARIVHVDPISIYGQCFDDGYDKLPSIENAIHVLKWHPYRTLNRIVLEAAEHFEERLKTNIGADDVQE